MRLGVLALTMLDASAVADAILSDYQDGDTGGAAEYECSEIVVDLESAPGRSTHVRELAHLAVHLSYRRSPVDGCSARLRYARNPRSRLWAWTAGGICAAILTHLSPPRRSTRPRRKC